MMLLVTQLHMQHLSTLFKLISATEKILRFQKGVVMAKPPVMENRIFDTQHGFLPALCCERPCSSKYIHLRNLCTWSPCADQPIFPGWPAEEISNIWYSFLCRFERISSFSPEHPFTGFIITFYFLRANYKDFLIGSFQNCVESIFVEWRTCLFHF